MTPYVFDKILLSFSLFFIGLAITSLFNGRWFDVIVCLIIASYGRYFVASIFESFVKHPSPSELAKSNAEKIRDKSIENIKNIRDLPTGTLYDVKLFDGRTYADNARTINFSREISEYDLEEAINFLIDLCSYEFTYERLRKMMRKMNGHPIEFICQAQLVMVARGVASRLPYRKDVETRSLAQKNIYPWSYQGSQARFESIETLEHNEETFENL